jgi:molybdenum cofactor guanylyltransferase
VDAIAAILAGGRSSRMGRAKSAIKLANHALISYPIAAAQAAGLERIVVAKPGSELPKVYCPVIEEPEEPSHPLLGIVTALRHEQGPVLALGCDMPFVDEKLLAWIASHLETAVPEVGGRLQPLLARYGPEDLEALEAALDRGDPLRQAAAELEPIIIPETDLTRFGDPARLTFNVNTPADLAEAERIFDDLARQVPSVMRAEAEAEAEAGA